METGNNLLLRGGGGFCSIRVGVVFSLGNTVIFILLYPTVADLKLEIFPTQHSFPVTVVIQDQVITLDCENGSM